MDTEYWRRVAHPNQLAPTDTGWSVWLLTGGRHSGKTRAGAEYVCEQAELGFAKSIIIMVASQKDVANTVDFITSAGNDTANVLFDHNASRLFWPSSNASAYVYPSAQSHAFRGTHADLVWGDDYSEFSPIALTNLMIAANKTTNPRAILTGTPKEIMTSSDRDLARVLKEDPIWTRHSVMHTFDNPGIDRSHHREMAEKFNGSMQTDLEGNFGKPLPTLF